MNEPFDEENFRRMSRFIEQMGYDDYFKGIRDCPYPLESSYYISWSNGWYKAAQEVNDNSNDDYERS